MRSACMALILSVLFPAGLVFAADDAPPQENSQSALFYKLTPSLITNVQGRAAYVRCDIQLMTRGENKLDQIALHEPALRHELLLMLGDQQSDTVTTPKGKEKLRKALLKAVRGVMESHACGDCVDDPYFTSFFVQ